MLNNICNLCDTQPKIADLQHTVVDIVASWIPKILPQCRPNPLAAIAVPIRVVLIAAVFPVVPFGI